MYGEKAVRGKGKKGRREKWRKGRREKGLPDWQNTLP